MRPTLSKTVLLVHDLELLRELIHEFLQSLGMEVLEASDATEAIQITCSHTGRIDLLLTDIKLPGKSGRELANKIASLRPGIRILFMSAGDGLEECNDSREKSVETYFIQKPFRLKALKALLMDIFSR